MAQHLLEKKYMSQIQEEISIASDNEIENTKEKKISKNENDKKW